MGFKQEGRIHTIGEPVQVTERFRKREFVLTIDPDGKYPQPVQFELTGDRCELLDHYAIGQDVSVNFSLNGREWTNREGEVRLFNSLRVWEIDAEGAAPEAPAEQSISGDDLPF